MKADAERVELPKVVDGLRQTFSRQSIERPYNQQIELTLAGIVHHLSELWAISGALTAAFLIDALCVDCVAVGLAPTTKLDENVSWSPAPDE